jgi:hypothetical protein
MRHLILAVVAMGVTHSALAQTPMESCTEIPALAEDVMKSRQVNYDIMLMINRLGAELSDHFELMSWAQGMIDMAYSQPIASTPEAREQQVEDFKTLWLERCQKTQR